MTTREFNFDGLVGPTHNYSGLSFGNVASSKNQGAIANPKRAALQGLDKMKRLADLGFGQGVLAPQARPDLDVLRAIGFTGSDAEVVQRAAKTAPALLASAFSASSMWTANAATVSASADTADGKVHFTPANLNNKFHRSLEHPTTGRILKAVFPEGKHFVHHPALPGCPQFGDEGAANHTRLTRAYGEPGIELFVYGCSGFDTSQPAPKKFPARQTLEASQAVARLHGLDGLDGSRGCALFVQQNPDVIDAGVFHNDVIAVGNGPVLFYHQDAFLGEADMLKVLRNRIGDAFAAVVVPNAAVSVADAVQSYLFNSQLLTKPDGKMLLLVPSECDANIRVKNYLAELVQSGGPINEVLVMDLRESMMNGGGPACLRLRVELQAAEAAAVNPAVLMNDSLHATLTAWVEKHYRDCITTDDLTDPTLIVEARTAVDELTRILKLGNVYAFQSER